MNLLEDGTLVVETAEQVKKIKRVIVLQEGTHYCGVYYPEQGEEWQEALSGFAWVLYSDLSPGFASAVR